MYIPGSGKGSLSPIKKDTSPVKDVENKKNFKTGEGRTASGVKVTREYSIESKLLSATDAFKVRKIKLFHRLIVSLTKKRVEKKIKKQLAKIAISQAAQVAQDKIRSMEIDYKNMKPYEKSPISTSLKNRYESLKDKYNIASSSDLLILINQQVKTISKIENQVKNEKKELDQLKEKVKSNLAKLFTEFQAEIVRTNSTYRKEIKEHEGKIKSLKASMESAELSPENLKSILGDLKNAEDILNVI